MPDSRVNINAASGTVPVDGFTQSDGDVRQAVVLGDATGAQTATVDTAGRLLAAVSGASTGSTAATQIESTTANSALSLNVAQAGNVTFWLAGSSTATGAAVTAGSVTFEQSQDGNSWALLPVVRSDLGTATTTYSGTIASGGAIAFDAAVEGVNFVRVRPTANSSSGALWATIVAGGMPFAPSTTLTGSPTVTLGAGTAAVGNMNIQAGPSITKGTQATNGFTVQPLRDAGRTYVGIMVDSVAASAATTETLASYGGNNGSTALTAGTGAFTVPSGKTFRITSMTVTATGSAAGSIRVRLRASASTTGPLLAGAHVIVPAASGGDTVPVAIPDGIELAAGTVLGISFFASATTITYSVNVTGFHY